MEEKSAATHVRASLALASLETLGPHLFQRILAEFTSVEAVFSASKARLAAIAGVGDQLAGAISDFHGWDEVDRQIERTHALGLEILCAGTPGYSDLLARIAAPPPILYLQGNIRPEDAAAVAVVGTRKPDTYGRRAAREIAGGLGARGVTIVSGLARGIDQEAHQASLDRGGRTLAVLGCGLDVDYPRGSGALRKAILARGALISEFPPGTPPLPQHFPRRNRIISGLSWGVVLVQGTRRSGGINTVGYALEQNREVFCVPGGIYSELSEAPHAFLKQGATLAESAEDVLAVLGSQLGIVGADDATAVSGGKEAKLSPQERELMLALASSESIHRDELAAKVGLDPAEVAPILLRLELSGLIQVEPGGHYSRC